MTTLLCYKRTGETTADFSNRIKSQFNWNKVAICGKLDPMARGLVTVLPNDHTKLMDSYLNTCKEYEFDIVDGISTDSDDILGFQKVMTNIRHKDLIDDYMQNLYYKKSQQFHHFSAKRLNKLGQNKPLWYWFKEGLLDDDEIPSKDVSVFNVKKLSESTMPIIHYRDLAVSDVKKLNSDKFNKENIIKSWESIEDYNMKPVDIYKFKITVTSGFYVRMIAKELNEIGVNCHIHDIHRTHVYSPSEKFI